ncbi:MAG: sulfur oxidation c-type cytochrome SoxA [Sulfurifustaceae bacterium]
MTARSRLSAWFGATVLLATVGFALSAACAHADPATDLNQFRQFFKKKFPSVRFDDFANGIYALPGMDDYRMQWESLSDFPLYEIGLDQGRREWETPFKNGKTYAGCFVNGGKNIAQHYPYWHEASRQVRTVEMDLIECVKRNGEERRFTTADLNVDAKARAQLANLTAAFYELSKGQRIEIDLSDAGAVEAYEEGKRFWWSRRGQLNFSCANCHMDLAGKNLGGNQPLSAALGHPVGWPAYRTVWGQLETVHYRYATCNSQVRAKPAPIGSRIYNNLQLYETYLSSGLPLAAPSVRN